MPEKTPRVLNPDGSVNVARTGLPRQRFGDLYHFLLTTTWRRFYALAAIAYVLSNAGFALAYLALGNVIENAARGSFADAFFFSVQTMATIGYGKMTPLGLAANLLVTAEVMVGLLFFALITGLTFAKFTQATAGAMFSNVAVISAFNGIPTLMFRIANERESQVIEARIYLVLVIDEITAEGERIRRFHDLKPARQHSPVFALSWTVMHPIDESSPLFGKSRVDLEAGQGSVLAVFTGFHEGFSQTVHARHVYDVDEIIWNARFVDIFSSLPDGRRLLDFEKFHQVTRASAAKSDQTNAG